MLFRSAQNFRHLPSVRLGYITMGIDSIPVTELDQNQQPQKTGSHFSDKTQAMYMSWQKSLSTLDFGIRGLYFSENLNNKRGNALSLDLAAHKVFQLTSTQLHTGITYKNALSTQLKWNTNHTDSVPSVLNIGATSAVLSDKLFLSLDIEKEATKSISKWFGGFEYWLSGTIHSSPSLALRAGIKNNDITLGLGLNLNGFIMDYAYVKPELDFLEHDHLFSIGWSIFPFSQTYKKSSIPAFEPVKTQLIQKKPSPSLAETAPILLSEIHCTPDNDTSVAVTIHNPEPLEHYTINAIDPHHSTKQHTTFPVQIRLNTATNDHVILLEIDQSESEHLIISGFIPSEHKVLFNNHMLFPDEKDRSVFHKTKLIPGETGFTLYIMGPSTLSF